MKKILLYIVLTLLIVIGTKAIAQDKALNLVSFGGHAFTNDFPIKLGYASLYNSEKELIETAIIDTLGYYYFYKQVEGDYYIRVGLDANDPNFGDFYPTYYPNTAFVSDAQLIGIYEDNWELDIDMYYFKSPEVMNGPGRVNGHLELDNSKIEISGINVMILDENNAPIRHTESDRFGNFQFDGLPYGNYILHPDLLGFETTPLAFTISDESNIYEDIIFTLKDGTISSFIDDALVNAESLEIYPNPATQYFNLNVEFNGVHQIQTRILDISGRVILTDSQDNANQQFNSQFSTMDWEAGFYFVEIFVDGSKAISQKMTVVH